MSPPLGGLGKTYDVHLRQGRLSPQRRHMVRSPQDGRCYGWVRQFFIIMHLKCCAYKGHDLSVL